MPLQELASLVQQKADLAQIISMYFPLQEGRKALKGTCPFHADPSASLMVLRDKNIFKCFGCGKEGGPIEFVMEMEGRSYQDTVMGLASKFGLLTESTV